TMRGNPAKVCHHYMQIETEDSMKKMGLRLDSNISEVTWQGSGEVVITNVEKLTCSGEKCQDLHTCDPMKLRVHYEAYRKVKAPIIGIAIYTSDMLVLSAFSNESASLDMVMEGEGRFECIIPSLPMLPGIYSIGVSIKGRDNSLIYKGLHLTSFNMQYNSRSKQSRGFIHIEPEWNFAPGNKTEKSIST
ncbi:MAG: Wzt carbohydrate-binding domain-containing protein, partial [Planctomycetota bacterium]